ncbi:MAG TPA: CDP-diacylglycerol O-phosphatidyltransferase [Candidatus Binatia bacterium]
MAGKLILAWLVHLYSASGTVLAFFSVLLVQRGDFKSAFWLNALAVAIDASDGTLARAARVKERIPWFDGARLEDIIDYLNYVLVPSLILVYADLLPRGDALWIAALPMLASAYGFCQKEAKTADNYFLGFPSYWNIVVFYLFVLRTPVWLNGFIILALSVLVLVPIKYIYPSRTAAFQWLTLTLGAVWGVLVLLTIYYLPAPPPAVVYASLVFPAYYTALSFWLARPKRPAEAA